MSNWKVGRELAPFHPDASHVEPGYRDGWNDCYTAMTAERDELRRQLDPMGEYTSADELIAALRAEKAKDDAMKQDARRYRWLRGDLCPDHSVRWTQWEVRCWKAPSWTGDLRRADLDDAIDAAIDAAKGRA